MDMVEAITKAWPLIVAAPLAAFALVALGATGAWWFRGQMASSEIRGLQAEIGAWKVRLDLANDQQRALTERLQLLQVDLTKLESQRAQGLVPSEIAATTASIVANVSGLISANTALGRTITTSGGRPIPPPGPLSRYRLGADRKG
jgi:hypothetical protein